MSEEVASTKSPEMQMLSLNKESGYNYRERRHEPWREINQLYRDDIEVNRLTQRQSVHVPLMKKVVRTLLKDVDDMPVLYFENLDNDKEAEIAQNEHWKHTVDINNMELQDIVDKKQVFLNGRSFDQWQILNGEIKMTIQDPQDILVSRYTDPTDLHSSRFLIHNHIYVPLSEIESNPDYDKGAIKRLKMYYATEQGLIKVADNENMANEKADKLADLGVEDAYSPILGETYVELSLHFVYRDNEEAENESGEVEKVDDQIWMYVEADDQEILMKKPLEEVIGVTKDHFWRTHFPYESWADDIERQDFWTDGVGDIVKTPNKILDAWMSQLVENRTLRNFGMTFYDSTIEGFEPNTFNPVPWGFYGMPGDPNKITKRVDIPELSESLDEMQFVITMTEDTTGATSTQQGKIEDRQVTLGEVQLALGEAKERVKGMAKFYAPAWKRRGLMYLKMIEAGHAKLKPFTAYKKGRNTQDIFEKTISPKDWMTRSGYGTKVWSQEEKDSFDTNMLQKLDATIRLMPFNDKLIEIYQRKLLEFDGLTPDEINDVMEQERRNKEALLNMGGQDGTMPNPGQPLTLPQGQATSPPV